MCWTGHQLTIDIDEPTVPLPSRVRGRVTVTPRGLGNRLFNLDAAGRHRWQPIAPLSDVTVALDKPDLAWEGTGYLDSNNGDEPLETAFKSWTWSRFDLGERARIFYDVVQRDGVMRGLSLSVEGADVREGCILPYHRMPTTGWGIARAVPCENGSNPTLIRTMENAPFYVRSAVRSRIDGAYASGVHESLSLDRVKSPIVRLMLPFKMFRRVSAAPRDQSG